MIVIQIQELIVTWVGYLIAQQIMMIMLEDATDEDGDDDNDGVSDSLDSCSTGDLGWTSDENTDYDGDGCQDDSTEDLDDDNDGMMMSIQMIIIL